MRPINQYNVTKSEKSLKILIYNILLSTLERVNLSVKSC